MKRKSGRAGIKWRLFACFAGFAVIVLSLLWIFQIVFLDDFYQLIKIRSIKDAAANIGKNIDNEDLQSLVTNIALGGEMCVLVYNIDQNGQRLADADLLVGCMLHKISAADRYVLCMSAVEGGGEYLNQYTRSFFRDWNYDEENYFGAVPKADPGLYDSLLYVKVVENQADEQIGIMINSAISPVDATVQTLISQLMIITVIMLLLAAVIAIALAKLISEPIARLNRSAKALATGNYDVRFDAQGYREITELSDSLGYAAKELARVDEYRRELIANVSHDMRTPLTLIAGYGEAMKDIPSENTTENLDIIIAETKRLTELVNDMLEQAKYRDGNIRIEPEIFDLAECMNEIMVRYMKFTEQDGYQIDVKIDEELYVHADRQKITQATYNLINNAISYTGQDKKIFISAVRAGNFARVEIRDTGEGIAADKLPHIWNRYYKIDKAHKRSALGSGLGLSIVKNIMDLHGARYGVISKLCAGSTFWFELPLSALPE